MTDEQFEKRMQFILEQQASFAAGLQRLEEAQARHGQAQRETDERIRKLVDVSLSLANHVEGLTSHVEEIDRRLASFVTETNERFQRLAESQAHTDQRLDTLIDIVRRQAERGNGRQIQ
jgi:hypothetical protein